MFLAHGVPRNAIFARIFRQPELCLFLNTWLQGNIAAITSPGVRQSTSTTACDHKGARVGLIWSERRWLFACSRLGRSWRLRGGSSWYRRIETAPVP